MRNLPNSPHGETWIRVGCNLDKVEEIVDHVLCRVDGETLPIEKLFGLRLALHEALSNAIRHGNRNRPELPVSIRFRRKSDRLEITIRDEGEGFDCNALPDPTVGENLYQCSGRGVFLMRKLVDEVAYNERGNEVTLMVRHRRDPRLSTPPDSCGKPPSR